MRLKKIIAGVSAFAIAAAVLPRVMPLSEVSAADLAEEMVSISPYNSVMAAAAAEAEIDLPNSIATEEFEFDDFKYKEKEDGTLYITDYSSEAEKIVFPAEINGKTVTDIYIQDISFKKHVSVTIPETVRFISFDYYTVQSNLKEIIVDENNKTYASKDGVLFNKDFTELVRYPSGKAADESEYTLPDTVTSLGTNSFMWVPMTSVNATDANKSFSSVDGVLFSKDKTELFLYPMCKSGTEYIVPKSVAVINSWTFDKCQELSSVILQEGLKTIHVDAFSSCEKITSLTIPASVTQIDTGAFLANYLESVTVADGNENYFTDDGVLFNKDASILILYPPKKSGSIYTVPDSVITIGQDSFGGASINQIIFGKNVAEIELLAFSGCSGIGSVVFPDSIKIVEPYAFMDCMKLTSVTIPAGLERLGNVTADTYNYGGYSANVFLNSPGPYNPIVLMIHGAPGTVAEKYAIFWGIGFMSSFTFEYNFTVIHSSTGVIMTFTENSLPENIEKYNIHINIEKKPCEEYENATVYDISLIYDEQPIQPKGDVYVKIPVPADAGDSSFKVYHRDENGKLTDMKAVLSSDIEHNDTKYMFFATDHFSEYILTTEKLISDFITGDVDGSSNVDDRDSIYLDRYLADWGNEINLDAADVNGDGMVNDRDSIMLARTLAGWYD